MAFVHEYECGCIIHDVAGALRKCQGLTSRSLSGKMVSKGDGGEKSHNSALSKAPVKTYEVANILP